MFRIVANGHISGVISKNFEDGCLVAQDELPRMAAIFLHFAVKMFSFERG